MSENMWEYYAAKMQKELRSVQGPDRKFTAAVPYALPIYAVMTQLVKSKRKVLVR